MIRSVSHFFLIIVLLSAAVPVHAIKYGFHGLLMQPDTWIEIDGKTAWVRFPLQMSDPSEWKYHDCFTLSYLDARMLRAKGKKARIAGLHFRVYVDGEPHWLSHTICVVDIDRDNVFGIIDRTPLKMNYVNQNKLTYYTKKQEDKFIAEYAYRLEASLPLGVSNGIYLLIKISVHPYGTQYAIRGHRFDPSRNGKPLRFHPGGVMGIIVENGEKSEIIWRGEKLPEIARLEPLLHHMIKITVKKNSS